MAQSVWGYESHNGEWGHRAGESFHRRVRVGRDLCGSSGPTPCRSRGTYSRLHGTVSRWVLNISREGDSTTSLGNLFQGFACLRVKKFFLMFSWNFLCFSLCPLSLPLPFPPGPEHWHENYPMAKGDKQSPIEISSKDVRHDTSLGPWHASYDPGAAKTILNNGRTCRVVFDDTFDRSGGFLVRLLGVARN